MWLWLILTVAALAALIYLYGIFSPVTIYRDKWLSPHLLHFSFRGKREQIGEQFDKIRSDMENHFKLATGFGIYYTMPNEPVWQCVLGFEVNPGQPNKVASFLEEHPEYKQSRLKSTRYVGSMLPYLNYLSFFINVSKIATFYQLIKQDKVEPYRALIERYHFLSIIGKQVELVNPVDNQQQWNLLQQS